MDRTKIPVIREAREVDYILPECKQVWFDNGVPLYYINQGSQEVISLDIVFPAGEYYQPKRGVARAAAALFRSGTSARTAIEVDEAIEQYGANLKAGVNADRVFINLTCLSKFADPLISLIAELIQDTGYDESELELYRARMKQSLSIQLQKTDFVANRLIDEKIFGFAHPYGTYMAMDDYESLQRQDLLSFREKNYQIRNAKIFLAGKFEETKLVGTLQKHFGGMEEIETGEEPDYPILPADIKRYKENIGNEGVQGSVRVGRLFVDKDHEDYTPFQFVNMLFGGFFGSRLMRNIREEKGFTYGIYSYIPALVHSGAFLISCEAGKEVCERTLEEVFYEMKKLREEKVSGKELNLVKNYLLGKVQSSLDGPFRIMQQWKNLVLNGFDRSRFDDNIRVYKKITPERVQDLAHKYFREEEFYSLIVS